MNLTDMQMSAEEAREDNGCCAPGGSDESDLPKYPYGLSISLNDGVLEKLGLTALPDVGASMTLTARVEVCSNSQYQDRSGKTDRSVSLQITAMELSGAGESAEASPADVLYTAGK